VPAGNTIILDLALDRDGILHVSAKEKATGLERRITINNAMSRYDNAEIEEARQHIDHLFGEAVDETATADDVEGAAPADPKLEALLAKARAKLDGAIAEDRTEIVDLIEAIEDSRASNDAAGLSDAARRLDDLLFYLDT
jgi:molecular chaperone DnaK (HSP70)